MCEPITIAALATAAASAGAGATVAGLSVGATALAAGALVASAGSAYQASAAQKAQAKYQAQVARNNQTMANYAAEDAIKRSAVEEGKQRQAAAQLKGRQQAILAGNGVDIGFGSADDILTDTDYFGEADALTIRSNAARQAWGYQVEGQNYQGSAAMYDATAKAEKPWAAAATSLLSSAGQFAASGSGKSSSTFSGTTSASSAMNTTRGFSTANFA